MTTPGMTTDSGLRLRTRRLPAWAPWAIAAVAAALSIGLVYAGGLFGGGAAVTVAVGVPAYLGGLAVTAGVIEGSRAARDRLASALIHAAFAVALIPLVSVTVTVIGKGGERLNADFLTHSMNGITAFDSGGGIYHAIIGTLEQVGIATLITVPLGIGAAVYVVEYGRGRLAAAVRFFVDVMTGVPSIVAGLFILAFWVMVVSPMLSDDGLPHYSGFAAALALSVLMLPTITRACEEMIRLVPDSLREGAYALGVPKWKTVTRIVLPTALPGIVTGVMLAIARAAGETAPVLLVAGGFAAINTNPFEGNQASLATYIYDQIGAASQYGPQRAWAAALTLVGVVLALTVTAKLLARRNKITR